MTTARLAATYRGVGISSILGLSILLSIGEAGGALDSEPAILSIAARPDQIVLELGGSAAAVRIVELRPYETYTPAGARGVAGEGRSQGAIAIPRHVEGRDRLYSKFQLVNAATGQAIGPSHWVTDLSALPAWDVPMPWPESKKGISCPVDLEDLKTLGARYADDGFLLAHLFDWSPGPWQETWEVDGQLIGINRDFVEHLDRRVKRMSELGINVTLIVVNGVPSAPAPSNPLIHPRTDLAHAPYHLGAFNLTDQRGLSYYRAAFEYLAHRYSDPAGSHGWVSGYVVGNELQSHWAWHNMGRATPEEVTREYADQLRVAWLAVRRYHRDVRVYASMDHTWATHLDPDPQKSMRGDQFLERLNEMVTAEGNFPWHVAFHPYPENLFDPRFWRDQTAVLGFDTARITFKNLEVLPAFLAQQRFLYQGQTRHIILSEQGFHCTDEPDGELVQAAAFALAHYKVRHLPTIDAFILHRHVDHRDQDGLRLGLWTRKLDDPDPNTPDRKRPLWDVFRCADTQGWEEAFAFAKPIVGIHEWQEMLPKAGPFPQVSGRFAAPIDAESIVVNLLDNMATASVTNCLAWRFTWAENQDGLLCPALLHHPLAPDKPPSEAVYHIALPRLPAGRKLVLRFGTTITGPTHDGVTMAVVVNDQVLWTESQLHTGQPRGAAVDLSSYAGQSIRLALRVDARGNNAGDWSHWLQPVIVSDAGAE
jgi:hypothetical protein